jgi:hypothetical protein
MPDIKNSIFDAAISRIGKKKLPIKRSEGHSLFSGRLHIHHTAIDTYDKINPREVLMGAAAMAALIAHISKYGL